MKVFVISCKVHSLAESIMPSSISKAFVNCYTYASSYEKAVKKILHQLQEDGIFLDEIVFPVHTMPISNWEIHIHEQFNSLASQMLTQSEFQKKIQQDKVVYGIFGGFN